MINSSVKNVLDDNINYTGLDIANGDNVDVVLKDLINSHSQMKVLMLSFLFPHLNIQSFWLMYLEILECLKRMDYF